VFDVTVFGSANLDLVVTVERHPLPGETLLGDSYAEFPGGKGLNQVVAAARAGASTSLHSAVGDDAAGDRLRSLVLDEKVDDAHLLTSAGQPTGRAAIVVSASGENSIVVVPGANANVVAPGALAPCRVLLTQLEVPLIAVQATLTLARSAGTLTLLNPAPAQLLDDSLLSLCDIVIPNEHEVELLGGIDALHAAGVGIVIVTRGADGVTISRDGAVEHRSARAVDVVDTTGAGDAFCGNLAARLALGDGLPDAIDWAIAAGALAVTVAGAVPSLPYATQTTQLIG
jgi:ribokinase